MPQKNKFKFAPIDFVPRRKPDEEIVAVMEKEKRKTIIVAPAGV